VRRNCCPNLPETAQRFGRWPLHVLGWMRPMRGRCRAKLSRATPSCLASFLARGVATNRRWLQLSCVGHLATGGVAGDAALEPRGPRRWSGSAPGFTGPFAACRAAWRAWPQRSGRELGALAWRRRSRLRLTRSGRLFRPRSLILLLASTQAARNPPGRPPHHVLPCPISTTSTDFPGQTGSPGFSATRRSCPSVMWSFRGRAWKCRGSPKS